MGNCHRCHWFAGTARANYSTTHDAVGRAESYRVLPTQLWNDSDFQNDSFLMGFRFHGGSLYLFDFIGIYSFELREQC